LISSLACATQVWNVLCRFSIPFGGELKVLFNAFSVFVFLSEFNLGIGITTFSGLPIPLDCFFHIRSSKPVPFIGDAQPKLSLRVALLRSQQHPRFAHRWIGVC